jgi:hypothetical protein
MCISKISIISTRNKSLLHCVFLTLTYDADKVNFQRLLAKYRYSIIMILELISVSLFTYIACEKHILRLLRIRQVTLSRSQHFKIED